MPGKRWIYLSFAGGTGTGVKLTRYWGISPEKMSSSDKAYLLEYCNPSGVLRGFWCNRA